MSCTFSRNDVLFISALTVTGENRIERDHIRSHFAINTSNS